MTAPGQYAAQDGSFARSAGGAAGRGIILIVVAVAIGLVLLAKGFDGGDTSLAVSPAGDDTSAEPAAEGDEPAAESDEPAAEGDEPAADDGDSTTDTPVEPGTTRPPGEVKVAAVNATGEPGLASTAAGKLDTQGYVTAPKNGSTIPTEASTVYYLAGYSEDAKAVASILGIPADLILPTEADDVLAKVARNENVSDFHIFIIQGTDRLAG